MTEPATTLLFHTALACEAAPLIAAFKLKSPRAGVSGKIYSNRAVSLVISGVGGQKTIRALDAWLSQHPPPHAAFNIGICGAASHHAIGSALAVTSVRDLRSGERFELAGSSALPLPAAALATVEQPQLIAHPDVEVVDMEAAAFAQVMQTHVPSHRLFCIKVVSDHMQGGRLLKSEVSIRRRQDWHKE